MFEEIEKSKYFECSCSSPEHTLIFNYLKDSTCHEVYTTTFLGDVSFWNRLKNAFKYILGYKCKYGHFDCFILQEKDLNKLINLLQEYKSNIEEQKKNSEPS